MTNIFISQLYAYFIFRHKLLASSTVILYNALKSLKPDLVASIDLCTNEAV